VCALKLDSRDKDSSTGPVLQAHARCDAGKANTVLSRGWGWLDHESIKELVELPTNVLSLNEVAINQWNKMRSISADKFDVITCERRHLEASLGNNRHFGCGFVVF